MSIGFRGPLNRHALVYSIQSVVARHDALRSTISKSGEEILIHRQTPIQVEDQHIESLPTADQKEWLARCAHQEAKTTFCRSEERRVGKEGVSKCITRWSQNYEKKKNNK